MDSGAQGKSLSAVNEAATAINDTYGSIFNNFATFLSGVVTILLIWVYICVINQRRNVARYEYKANSALTVFGFESVGRRGSIAKRVEFQHVGWTDAKKRRRVYNLAFGDWDAEKDDFDDRVISNNGDAEQVLATVASTVYAFLEAHPGALVLLEGSTPARTRLYRMGINKWIDRVEADFEVLGFKGEVWEKYMKGGDYGVLLLQRKGDKFEHRF